MRRFRLSTLMLLIVIAALGITVVMQARRLAETESRIRMLKNERDDLYDEVLRLERENGELYNEMMLRYRTMFMSAGPARAVAGTSGPQGAER